MPKFSSSLLVKAAISFFLVTFSLTLIGAAPTLSPESNTVLGDLSITTKLTFWFQHDGNHQHEYSSESDIVCDPLPESLSRNWNTLTVFLERSAPILPNNVEERCAILFHHPNCVDPVLAVDLASPKSSLSREVKSFRYCHSSCDKCPGAVGKETRTALSAPDYDAVNK